MYLSAEKKQNAVLIQNHMKIYYLHEVPQGSSLFLDFIVVKYKSLEPFYLKYSIVENSTK